MKINPAFERTVQDAIAAAIRATQAPKAVEKPPMSSEKNHMSIISLWPGPTSLAADLGVSLMVARGIRARGWIPDWYWYDLVKIAEQRGMRGVSLERLAKLSKGRRP